MILNSSTSNLRDYLWVRLHHLQSQEEVARLRAAAEEEIEAIKEEGRRRLDDCTSGLREDLVAAEEALQVCDFFFFFFRRHVMSCHVMLA